MESSIFKRIYRGDIYYVDFGNQPGSVEHGVRPAMVVQNDVGNRYAPTVIVAAITSEIKKLRQPTRIKLGKQFGLTFDSMLLLEQLFTIDKSQLETYVGTASNDFLREIDRSIAVSVGIHPTICNSRQYKPVFRLSKIRRKTWDTEK